MANFSLFEKLKIVFGTILSTPLFSITAILGFILIGLIIFCIIKHKNVPKKVQFICWIFIIAFIIFKYSKIIPTLLDNLVDTVFKCLYFPSLGFYMSIILLINFIFILMNIIKTVRKSYKIVCGITAVLLNVLFIIVAGVVTMNKINIAEEINLYTNSTLLVLLQISMGIFMSFLIVILFIKLYLKLTLLDGVKYGGDEKYPDMDVVINEIDERDINKVIVKKIMKIKNKKDLIVRKVIKSKEKSNNDDLVVRKVIK